jgi:hypothetical protein
MPAPDVYRPDEWHDFFLTVGGAAAVLTGLVLSEREETRVRAP